MEELGLDSISGHLLAPWEMPLLGHPHIPLVSVVVAATGRIQHLSLEMTTSAILVAVQDTVSLLLSLMTHCGMVLGVDLEVLAVHSTTLHGSARPSPCPPLMTWRSGSVTVLHAETHPSSSWRFMCSSYYRLVMNHIRKEVHKIFISNTTIEH